MPEDNVKTVQSSSTGKPYIKPGRHKHGGGDLGPPLTLDEFPSLAHLDNAWFKWQETGISVAEFSGSFELPQVVKVDGGDYGNFGVGTHVDVQRPFVLYTARRCSKVLAASVYFDDSKQQYVEVGPRVVIPLTYPGWFYFLQDAGKVGQTWKNVSEVVEAHPKAFLVRAPIPGLRYSRGRRQNGERVYVTEEIKDGEVLNYSGLFTEKVTRTKRACCFKWLLGKRTSDFTEDVQYLKCTDLDGQETLVEVGQEGVFSPLGDPGTCREDCVYQLSDLVRSVDLPVHVKLACGNPPTTPCSFTGLIRLEDVYFEETIIACTLGNRRSMMVEFPTDSDIQFFVALDAYKYFEHPVIQEALCHCDMNLDAYMNTIKVVQSFYPDHIKFGNVSKPKKALQERSLPPTPIHHLDESTVGSQATTDEFTDDSDFSDDEEEASLSTQQSRRTASSAATSQVPPDSNEYEEIPGTRRHVQVISLPPPGAEDSYLAPAPVHSYGKANKEQRVTNKPEIVLQPSLKSQTHNSSTAPRASGRRVAFAPMCDTENENHSNSSQTLKPAAADRPLSYTTGTHSFQKQLRDRLDAFLSDSLHEMHKTKPNENNVAGDPSLPQITTEAALAQKVPPKVPPKKRILDPQHALQSHEDMNAYLETIFDPDNMSQDGLSSEDAFRQTPNLSSRQLQAVSLTPPETAPVHEPESLTAPVYEMTIHRAPSNVNTVQASPTKTVSSPHGIQLVPPQTAYTPPIHSQQANTPAVDAQPVHIKPALPALNQTFVSGSAGHTRVAPTRPAPSTPAHGPVPVQSRSAHPQPAPAMSSHTLPAQASPPRPPPVNTQLSSKQTQHQSVHNPPVVVSRTQVPTGRGPSGPAPGPGRAIPARTQPAPGSGRVIPAHTQPGPAPVLGRVNPAHTQPGPAPGPGRVIPAHTQPGPAPGPGRVKLAHTQPGPAPGPGHALPTQTQPRRPAPDITPPARSLSVNASQNPVQVRFSSGSISLVNSAPAPAHAHGVHLSPAPAPPHNPFPALIQSQTQRIQTSSEPARVVHGVSAHSQVGHTSSPPRATHKSTAQPQEVQVVQMSHRQPVHTQTTHRSPDLSQIVPVSRTQSNHTQTLNRSPAHSQALSASHTQPVHAQTLQRSAYSQGVPGSHAPPTHTQTLQRPPARSQPHSIQHAQPNHAQTLQRSPPLPQVVSGSHAQPTRTQTLNRSPGHAQTVHTSSVHAQAVHMSVAQPGYAPTVHTSPAHSQAVHMSPGPAPAVQSLLTGHQHHGQSLPARSEPLHSYPSHGQSLPTRAPPPPQPSSHAVTYSISATHPGPPQPDNSPQRDPGQSVPEYYQPPTTSGTFSYNTSDATLRRHNMKNLQLVKPTPQQVTFIDDTMCDFQQSQNGHSRFVARPDHLPIQTLADALRNLKPAAGTSTASNNNTVSSGDNLFIPIERPNSSSPVRQSHFSPEYPRDIISSPDRFSDRVTNRTDSGIFVSPQLSDFQLECESPYQAPSEEPTWSPPDNLEPLSVTDVAHCLRYIGMKDPAVFRFVQEQVDGRLMLELDDMLLREGFPELNALERKKVLDFVGGWRPKKL